MLLVNTVNKFGSESHFNIKKGGFPDIFAIDDKNKKAIIIELKFDKTA